MSIRLKLLRKKLGVTLEALAEKSGMTKSYLSKVERGLNTPSIAAALKLAKALNVKVEELFSEDNVSLDSYSLVRSDERQSLAANDESPGYAVLAHQVSERSLLPFMIYPPTEFSRQDLQGTFGGGVSVRPRGAGGSGLHERAGAAQSRGCAAFQCAETAPDTVSGRGSGAVAGGGA